MNKYLESLKNQEIVEYMKILSADFPEFLNDYIDTPAMQKQSKISVSCGTYYFKMTANKVWYSSLDHSIAVALIIWNFTKNKKQTLAGLFHDIATPTFKHAIDFMNGDYENQESTENLTTDIIKSSDEIMNLLKRDNIKIEEIDDYHIYPIADNDTPRLAADRLEYTLSNGLGVRGDKIWNLEEIKEVYNSIEILKNEDEVDELGFNNVELAEKFVHNMSILSSRYTLNNIKFIMQFLADCLKRMQNQGLITTKDLYILSEEDVLKRIENCQDKKVAENYKILKNADKIYESDILPEGNKYIVSVTPKIRYINPLVKVNNEYKRINEISEKAKVDIQKALDFKTKKYAYLDFNF